jgi:hypothetical protein
MDGSEPKILVRDIVKPVPNSLAVDTEKHVLYYAAGEPATVRDISVFYTFLGCMCADICEVLRIFELQRFCFSQSL